MELCWLEFQKVLMEPSSWNLVISVRKSWWNYLFRAWWLQLITLNSFLFRVWPNEWHYLESCWFHPWRLAIYVFIFTSICFCILICQVESWGLTIEHTQGPPPPRPPPLAPENHHCAFAFNIKSTLYRAHYIHHYDFSMPCRRKSNISILCNCCCSTMFTLSRFLDPSQTWVHLSNIGEKHPKWFSDGNKIACFLLVPDPKKSFSIAKLIKS